MFFLCFPKGNKWIFPFPPYRDVVNEMEKLVLNQVGKAELRDLFKLPELVGELKHEILLQHLCPDLLDVVGRDVLGKALILIEQIEGG
jgi:hypothetical protein